jgi:hypothetical protein
VCVCVCVYCALCCVHFIRHPAVEIELWRRWKAASPQTLDTPERTRTHKQNQTLCFLKRSGLQIFFFFFCFCRFPFSSSCLYFEIPNFLAKLF